MEVFFKTAYPKWTNENNVFDRHTPQMAAAAAPTIVNDYDERTSSRTINALMEALRPRRDNLVMPVGESGELPKQPTSQPQAPASPTKSVISNLVVAPSSPTKRSGSIVEENAIINSSPTKPSPSHSLQQQQQQQQQTSPVQARASQVEVDYVAPASQFVSNLIRSAALANKNDEFETTLNNTNQAAAENNLIKEYEQEIMRRDLNASATLNQFENFGETITKEPDMNKISQNG